MNYTLTLADKILVHNSTACGKEVHGYRDVFVAYNRAKETVEAMKFHGWKLVSHTDDSIGTYFSETWVFEK